MGARLLLFLSARVVATLVRPSLQASGRRRPFLERPADSQTLSTPGDERVCSLMGLTALTGGVTWVPSPSCAASPSPTETARVPDMPMRVRRPWPAIAYSSSVAVGPNSSAG